MRTLRISLSFKTVFSKIAAPGKLYEVFFCTTSPGAVLLCQSFLIVAFQLSYCMFDQIINQIQQSGE